MRPRDTQSRWFPRFVRRTGRIWHGLMLSVGSLQDQCEQQVTDRGGAIIRRTNRSVLAMIVSRRYRISGRVQGVGFRLFALDAARREDVSGVARNLSGGDVEVVAEGDSEAVERFERAIRRGPSLARVDDVTVEIMLPAGRPPGFSVG